MSTPSRILFVDDEERVLDGLRAVLRKHRRRWDVRFALGGERALELLAKESFDVVVSDLRMPRVDGVAILKHVCETSPRTARIVLSGDVQPDAVLRVVPYAHQSLGKPCRVQELEAVLERACRLSELVVDPEVQAAIGAIGDLPSVPGNFARLSALLLQEGASAREIAEALALDVATSAKLLRLANSSFFGGGRSVRSVEDATRLLGVDVVRSVVLSNAAFAQAERDVPPEFADAMHEHALSVGVEARTLAPPALRSEAFTAGVLHDVGLVILAMQTPELASRILRDQLYGEDPEPTHAKLGAYLLGLWGLPLDTVEAVARHHEEPEGLPSLARAVAQAVRNTEGSEKWM